METDLKKIKNRFDVGDLVRVVSVDDLVYSPCIGELYKITKVLPACSYRTGSKYNKCTYHISPVYNPGSDILSIEEQLWAEANLELVMTASEVHKDEVLRGRPVYKMSI